MDSNKRQKVYEELIATERQYIQDMKMTQELFLEPVRDKGLLSKDEISSLFSNLSALIPLNQDLLTKLEQEVDVGTAFTDMIRHMKVYSIYCSSIHNIKERIDGYCASYPKFRQYLETCARNPACREMLLPDFLIMPLQRICKYPLLLKTLLECTPSDHADHAPLTSALAEMRQLIEICIHLLSDLVLISRARDAKKELKDIISAQESTSASKLSFNKRASRKLDDFKDVLTVFHKIELFTPPLAIDGTDFSGNLLDLVDVEEFETLALFTKMDNAIERVEFQSVDEKKSWQADVQKASKNCFESWKKDYFKSITEARMSQRSITAPLAVNVSSLSSSDSGPPSPHARSSSLGDIRVSAVVAAIEKGNMNGANESRRKTPKPVAAWTSAHVKPSRSSSQGSPGKSSIFAKSNSSTIPTPDPPPPSGVHPQQFTPNKKLPSFVSCPDLLALPLPHQTAGTSEQNWEVESEELSLRDSSRSFGNESGRSSAIQSEDSWSDISLSQSTSAFKKHPLVSSLRNLSDLSASASDVEFWEDVRRDNERESQKDREKEQKKEEAESAIMTPRGGSLVRSARRNFAMALAAEYASPRSKSDSNGIPTLPITDVFTVQQHELSKKDEEILELKKRLESYHEKSVEEAHKQELEKRDVEIQELKKQLADEFVRTKIFRDKFQEMQKLYHEADSRERGVVDVTKLNEEITELKRKFADERERRRFYRDKFQEMQKLYQESLDSVVEFQEKIKLIGIEFAGGGKGGDPAKFEQQLAEEKLRKQFFKDKYHEMQRLYQESLESVTSFVEKSSTAEKLYRSTLEDSLHSKRKAQELDGLYRETQESVEFFREKVHVVEEACRDALREAEYFRLKAEKLERSLVEAQRSVALYADNLDAMSGMLREAQKEALFYKQKSFDFSNPEEDTYITHDPREVENLYREAQANAEKYKSQREEAEERVKKLELAVAKLKKSNRPPTLPYSGSKLMRSPAKSTIIKGDHRRKTARDRQVAKPRQTNELDSDSHSHSNSNSDSDSDSNLNSNSNQADLPHSEEALEGVDFPWLDFVRSNYRIPTNLAAAPEQATPQRESPSASPPSSSPPSFNSISSNLRRSPFSTPPRSPLSSSPPSLTSTSTTASTPRPSSLVTGPRLSSSSSPPSSSYTSTSTRPSSLATPPRSTSSSSISASFSSSSSTSTSTSKVSSLVNSRATSSSSIPSPLSSPSYTTTDTPRPASLVSMPRSTSVSSISSTSSLTSLSSTRPSIPRSSTLSSPPSSSASASSSSASSSSASSSSSSVSSYSSTNSRPLSTSSKSPSQSLLLQGEESEGKENNKERREKEKEKEREESKQRVLKLQQQIQQRIQQKAISSKLSDNG